MLILLLSTVAAILACSVIIFFIQYNVLHQLLTHDYPLRKDKNFEIIKNSVGKESVPKAFRPISFPLSSWTGSVIFADYDLIKDAFSRKELPNRLFSKKLSMTYVVFLTSSASGKWSSEFLEQKTRLQKMDSEIRWESATGTTTRHTETFVDKKKSIVKRSILS